MELNWLQDSFYRALVSTASPLKVISSCRQINSTTNVVEKAVVVVALIWQRLLKEALESSLLLDPHCSDNIYFTCTVRWKPPRILAQCYSVNLSCPFHQSLQTMFYPLFTQPLFFGLLVALLVDHLRSPISFLLHPGFFFGHTMCRCERLSKVWITTWSNASRGPQLKHDTALEIPFLLCVFT